MLSPEQEVHYPANQSFIHRSVEELAQIYGFEFTVREETFQIRYDVFSWNGANWVRAEQMLLGGTNLQNAKRAARRLSRKQPQRIVAVGDKHETWHFFCKKGRVFSREIEKALKRLK